MGGNFKSPFRSLQSWRNWREIVMGNRIPWLLRDEFTDTRAAGAVNGTPATPGPGGNRAVTDANSKLSIGGGVASFATGGVGIAEPRMVYDSVARIAGRLCLAESTTSAEGPAFGLSKVNNARLVSMFRYFGPTALTVDAADNSFIASGGVAVVAYGTSYVLAVILRTAGCYYFIKGGAFTNWSLLYVVSTEVDDPLWPMLAADDNTSAFTSSYIRIPDALYLPTPLAYDTFTRANGALGSTEATGPDGQTAPVHAWNNRVGTTLIAGNVASASALVGGIAIATVNPEASANVIAQATLTRAGNEVGIIVRFQDKNNYVRAVHDGTNCQLIKRVAMVETTVITAVAAIGAGEIAVICEGTQFSLYLNNAKVGATSTIGDAPLQAGTQQGLFSTNVGNTQDALLVMPRGTNGEYSTLDRYSS